jgi:KipI family sensor histidine kinase inhibitor
MEIRRVGARGLLLSVEDPLAWHASLVARRAAGDLRALDVVPGAETVLLDTVSDVDAVAAALPRWRPRPDAGDPAVAATVVEIPVWFDGPDLPAVAQLWRMSADAVVERLAGTEFRAAFCGFAPGFAYLTGLPSELAVPRLPSPRPRVPAGSVGLAGEYAGIYPTASPGGWRLVGRTDVVLFDATADPPALLGPPYCASPDRCWPGSLPRPGCAPCRKASRTGRTCRTAGWCRGPGRARCSASPRRWLRQNGWPPRAWCPQWTARSSRYVSSRYVCTATLQGR